LAEFIDHQPIPKPLEMRMVNLRVAVFSEDRKNFIGLGNLAGEEFHNSPTQGAGVYECIHMDDTKILYGSDCFWVPLDQLSDEQLEQFGIKVDE
jgi:hypothetical protein